jgi:formamidopyrimidine-DNA glycosylase
MSWTRQGCSSTPTSGRCAADVRVPELLEVEAYRRAADSVVGRRIAAVRAPDEWYLKGGIGPVELAAALVGVRVLATRRVGKLLLIDTDGPVLGLRFGMTGRLVVDGEAPIDRLEYSSGRDLPEWRRFGLDFEPEGSLVMADPRRLGGVELDPDESRLGVDAAALDAATLAEVLASSTRAVKARLMDQEQVAGLGNLLADEILWRAGIDPARRACDLDDEDVARTTAAIAEVLSELGRRGGSHTGDLGPHRQPGGMCPRDGEALVRRTIGGRTSWSCPRHQR